MGPDKGPDIQKTAVESVMTRGVEQRGAAVTEEQKVARLMNASIEQGNPREALRIAVQPDVDTKKLDQKVEQIGTQRDEATGAKTRTPEEQDRYDKAKAASERAQKFIKEGYDKLTTQEQGDLQKTVVEQINKNPLLAERYRNMSRTDQAKYVDALIKDPKNAEKVREILSEIAESPLLSDLVADAKDKVREAEIDRDAKAAEIVGIKRRSDSIDARLVDFERAAAGGHVGNKAQELDRLRAEQPHMEAEINQLAATGQVKGSELARLQQEYAASLNRNANPNIRDSQTLSGLITQAEGELSQIQNNMVRIQGEINRIASLEEEEKGLESEKKKVEIEMRQGEVELKRMELGISKLNREYDVALSARATQEADIVGKLENVFANAAVEVINDRTEEALGQFEASLNQMRAKATTEAEKAIIDEIEKRHKRRVTVRHFRRTEVESKIDRSKVFADYNILMNEGPEAFMKAVVSGGKNPETNLPYTQAEVDEIMKDEGLIARMQPEAIKQLLAKRLMIGNMSEGDAYDIRTSKWGKDMLEQASEANQAINDILSKYAGENITDRPGFIERLGDELGSQSLLQVLLLGVVGAPLVAAVSAARSKDGLNV